jgi:XTP/dITP diphosphohydrolase
MTTLYAATGNKGKLAEFIQSASDFNIAVLALPGLKDIPEPIEDADTFQRNADLKARAYSLAAPGLLVIADDSGIEVGALGGVPGVRSARYADDLQFEPGTGTKDERNNRALLAELARVSPPASRSARFVCTLALARDGEVLLRAEGSVTGELLHAPRGTAGFGYDPLFLIPELNRTMAELAPAEKWQLSHRGNAFRSLLTQIQSASL